MSDHAAERAIRPPALRKKITSSPLLTLEAKGLRSCKCSSNGQDEWSRSRSLARRRHLTHRQSPHLSHRRVAALELATGRSRCPGRLIEPAIVVPHFPCKQWTVASMESLSHFGLFAVIAMLVAYALETRSPWFTLAFAGACALGSNTASCRARGLSGWSKPCECSSR